MISHGDGARLELFLRSGLDTADVVHAHREALLVLRDSIETAHLDAYSDEAWPQEAVPAYERALLMTEGASADGLRCTKSDPGMGIDIDVRDDAQFDILLALAPYTIQAEAWWQGQPLFSAADTGTALWIAVTSQQETQLRSRLGALKVTQSAFADRSRG
ncbi:hypothetical protein ACIBKZ_17015 [Streptomyces sp. NPDC050421]|uniref:hypothetical protein n=1 Tax=Streptomyces sp. NPDC050421 TaxID=3365613 RepID=UPI00379C2CA0